MISFTHNGVDYTNWTPAQAIKAGIPKAVIDQAVLDLRKAEVNAECKRRIYAVASPETQMNMATVSAVISGKSTSSRTATEKAILDGVEASLGWVAAMRTAAATIVTDPAKVICDDAGWPACPDQALAVADQF